MRYSLKGRRMGLGEFCWVLRWILVGLYVALEGEQEFWVGAVSIWGCGDFLGSGFGWRRGGRWTWGIIGDSIWLYWWMRWTREIK